MRDAPAFLIVLLTLVFAPSAVMAEESQDIRDPYTIEPGDILVVPVWKEPDLQAEVLVRPDGGFSFPLAGHLVAEGKSVAQVEAEVARRIAEYIPDPAVTVAVQQVQGNKVYVVGKVNRPGEFLMTGEVDVIKALAMAGGTNPFADLNRIIVLRRENGSQIALPFHYGEVERGKNLDQNIVLRSGDVVLVP